MFGFIAAGLGIAGAIGGYFSSRSANKAAARDAIAQGRMMYGQYMLQSQMSAGMARVQNAMAGMANQQAEFARDLANLRAADETTRAVMAQKGVEREWEDAAKRRRLLVGAGLVAYAGNGVLLEDRPDSAAARWEQDEMADLAAEMTDMKADTDLEVWGRLRTALAIRFQGEQDAYGYRVQALTARMDAATSLLSSATDRFNANRAITEAYQTASNYRAATRASLFQTIGSLASIGMNYYASGGGSLFSGSGGSPAPKGPHRL